jgi:hypothetical protein
MDRRLVILAGLAGLAGSAGAQIQTSPRCPVCKAIADGPHGWLVTSTQPDAISPAVQSALQVQCCPQCGVLYATV